MIPIQAVLTTTVTASTTTTAYKLDLSTVAPWAPKMAKLYALTIAPLATGGAASTTSPIGETNVAAQADIANGKCTLDGNDGVLLGDTAPPGSLVTIFADEVGTENKIGSAYTGINR